MDSMKLIELWGPLGGIAAMCGYLVIKAIPSMLERHAVESKETRELFQEELRAERTQRESMMQESHRMYRELSRENAETMQQLAATFKCQGLSR